MIKLPYLEYLDIILDAFEYMGSVALNPFSKACVKLHRIPSQHYPVTSFVVVDTNNPKARVLKQMLVRGQHIEVHQCSFHLLVCQCLADLLICFIATH